MHLSSACQYGLRRSFARPVRNLLQRLCSLSKIEVHGSRTTPRTTPPNWAEIGRLNGVIGNYSSTFAKLGTCRAQGLETATVSQYRCLPHQSQRSARYSQILYASRRKTPRGDRILQRGIRDCAAPFVQRIEFGLAKAAIALGLPAVSTSVFE